jgi:hypothetical protein
MPQDASRPVEPHPDEWQHDLNPEFLAGENYGVAGPHPEKQMLTAAEIKPLYNQLQGFSEADLKQISVMPEGSRLEQGATYIDLNDPERRPFTALANMSAGPDNLYVPKSEVDYVLWNRLIGVQNPERLDLADET